MRQIPTRENSDLTLRKAAGALFLLLSLTFLAGPQVLSAADSSQQAPTSRNWISNSLSFGTASINFGSVPVGSTKTITFTARNAGRASITVSSIAISSQSFTLTSPSLPVTLAAGQNTTIGVEFVPNAVGTFDATIAVTSDAANPVTDLSLTGTGMAVADGNLTPNSTSEAFGSVTVGAQQSQTVTLTNTGTSSVAISQAAISGAGFSVSGITTPLTLTAAQSTTFSVAFTPASAGSASGSLTLISNASNPTLAISLSGTGVAPGALGANPTSLSFGSVTLGSNQSLSETVTNTGGSSVTISQLAVSGSGFSVSGITTPLTLTAGQSTTFSVTFTPASAGSASGSLTLTSNASNPSLAIPLSGSGTAAAGQLTVTATTLAIGSVVVGTSGTASGNLVASGASVSVTAATSNNSAFSVSGLSFPLTIPAGQSASFTVNFSPQTTGAATATLTFTSNAQTSTTTETLTGTGTAAPTYSVNLSWTASTSPDISGYNIYRAVYTTSCGTFSQINSALNTSTLYTDSVVIDGTNYCYATTTVNSSNEESGYSNIVSDVQIPAP
jgi:Abnormal spindle-like microcephaly-assoc'd, ASPM-SPD-2-Hydin/Protein of unknown function (DUF1573)